jgi:hypothetical protein
VHRLYRVDLDRWQALSRSDHEELLGRTRAGARLIPLPLTSPTAKVQSAEAPLVVRRSADYLRIRSDVSRGLPFSSFSARPKSSSSGSCAVSDPPDVQSQAGQSQSLGHDWRFS